MHDQEKRLQYEEDKSKDDDEYNAPPLTTMLEKIIHVSHRSLCHTKIRGNNCIGPPKFQAVLQQRSRKEGVRLRV